jgi:heme/copper-type cytochrome/quinol oxidase subunit 2
LKSIKKNIAIINILMIVMVVCALAGSVSAAGGAPPGVQTDGMNTLVTIVFWAVRLIIIAVGAIPGIVKIVQGQSNEDSRERNGGIAVCVVTGICVAATFGIEQLFK